MRVLVLNDDHTKTKEIEAIRFDGPLNDVNYFKLYMSSTVAEEIYSWAYEFQINGERYHSNSAHHTLQQEDGSQIREVRLARV